MKRLSVLFVAVLIGALIISTSVSALVLNGDFETGTFGSWTKSAFVNNGFSSAPGSAATDLSAIVGGPAVLPLSQSDPRTSGNLQFPAYGNYSARVNDDRSHSGGGYPQNANRITQNLSAYIDPTDNLSHVKFAYAAVMVNPSNSHTDNEKPYFRVRVVNVTNANDVIYDFASYVNEPGKNWQDGANFGSSGEKWKYLNWQVIDLTSSPAHPVNTGDNIRVEVTAAGCSLGGHPGYVYVDEITDNEIAGPTVKATGPASVVTGGPITYTYNYRNGSASTIDTTVTVNQPSGVTFTSVSDPNCSLGSGTVTCNFTGMAPVSNGNFQITGNVTAAANTQLAHGSYSIASTGFPTVGGQTVLTSVVSPATTTSVGSSVNPSVFGQNVTLTATVTPNSGTGTPTGTVQFVVDGNNFGSPVALSGGTAQVSTSTLSVGTHTVTANYGGSANFDPSSGSLSGGQVVNRASTSTSVGTSNGSTTYGDSVTFTATVTTLGPGSGTPTGTVTFFDGPSQIAACVNVPLNGSGQAVCTINNLPAGSRNIGATYNPGPSFNGGANTVAQTVNKKDLSVTASSHTVTYGDAAPTVTPGYSGFVLGQNAGSLPTEPTCSTAYAASSPVSGAPYATNCSGGVSSNYNFVFTAGSVGVNKATLAVTASSHNVTYGDSAPAITPGYAGFVLSEGPSAVAVAPSCVTTYSQGSNVAGSPYTTSCSGGSAANYNFTFANGSVSVDRASLDVTASSHNITYGDAVPVVSPIYSGFVLGQQPSNLSTQPICSTTYTQGANVAGSPYQTSCDGGSAANYNINYINGAVSVARASLDVTASSHNVTYGDAAPVITPTYSGFVLGQQPSNLATQPTCSTTYTQGANVAGSPYPTSCGGGSAANYNINYINGAVSVARAALNVTASSHNVTYGDAVPTVTPAYSGFVLGQQPTNLTAQPACGTSYTQGTGAGTPGLTTSCSGGVSGNYDFIYTPGAVTVGKALLSVTASSHAVVYGAVAPQITASYVGFVLGQTSNNLTVPAYCSTTYTQGSPVAGAPYTTQCMGGISSNYDFAYTNGAITVSKAMVTITASSHTLTYGDPVPAVTPSYAGFLPNHFSGELSTLPTCSTSYTAGTAAFAPSLTTSCSGAAAANYDFTYVNGTVTVAKARLSVAAPSVSLTYGDPVPSLVPSISGFVLGQNASSLSAQPACTTTYAPGSSVGGYPTTCSGGSSSNYSFTFTGGNIAVGKKELTVTADNKNRIYGSPNPSLTSQFSGFVLGQTLATSGVTGSPALSTTAVATSPVAGGPYPIVAAAGTLASNNYSFRFVNGALTIDKALLTITANNASRVFGMPNPSFTFAYSGFVNGESAATAGVSGVPSLTTTATIESSVGQYPITASQGSLAAANYDFAFNGSTLTVTKAPTTTVITNSSELSSQNSRVGQPYNVTWVTAPFGSVTGTPSGNVLVSDGVGGTCTASATAGSCTLTSTLPGLRSITASYEGDNNFHPSASGAVFHPTVILISGNIKREIPFGTPENFPGVTVTIEGAISGQTTTNASGNYSFASMVPAGNYTVTPSGLGYTYSPTNRSYENVTDNVSNVDFIAGNGPVVVPSPTPQASPTPTPVTTPTPVATPTPVVSPSPTATPNPTPSPTPGTGIGGEGDVVDAAGVPMGGDGVTETDLAHVRNFTLGNTEPNMGMGQFQRADTAPRNPLANTFGDATLDASDVTVVRLYSLGILPNTTAAGPVVPDAAPTPIVVPGNTRTIRAVNVGTRPGEIVTVQFQVVSLGDESSASFTVDYDETVLSNPVVSVGNGVSTGTNLGTNVNFLDEGKIGILIDSVVNYAPGVRQIITIRFNVSPTAQTGLYPVTFENGPTVKSVSSNAGVLLPTTFQTGYVQIGSTASGVSVSGRVTSPTGQGVRNAIVTITDSIGLRSTATTGSFGLYRFDNVEPGRSYVVSVGSKRYRFATRVVNIVDSLTDLDFVGQQ